MIMDKKAELLVKINYDLSTEDVKSMRLMEERLRSCGISEEDISEVLLIRMQELEMNSFIRRSFRGELVCDEALYLCERADLNPDNGISETVFIDEAKEDYLRLVFSFDDAEIKNMKDFEKKLKNMGCLCDEDIIVMLDMRVNNLIHLKDSRNHDSLYLYKTEVKFLKERYPRLFENNFIDEAVVDGRI